MKRAIFLVFILLLTFVFGCSANLNSEAGESKSAISSSDIVDAQASDGDFSNEIDEVNIKIDAINKRLDVIVGRINRLSNDMDDIENQMGEDRCSGLSSQLHNLEGKVKELEIKEEEKHLKLSLLELEVNGLGLGIDRVHSQMSDIEKKLLMMISELQADVAALERQPIRSYDAEFSQTNSRLDKLENKFRDFQQEVLSINPTIEQRFWKER